VKQEVKEKHKKELGINDLIIKMSINFNFLSGKIPSFGFWDPRTKFNEK